ncbi:Exodeoxyribonuclease 7 large subunit [Dirofilaria immitis]
MASKPKRRKTEELDDTETILLGDDLKEIKNILLDFKEIKKVEELESKLKECPRIGVTLMTVLWKCSLQNFNEQSQWLLILNDVLRVLIKIYGTIPSLCSELAEPPGNFANIAVRLLESGPKVSMDAKCEVFRLIYNVAIDPRCMELIIENTHLVDRIAMAVDHDMNEMAKVALQMANLLAVNKNGIKISII